LGTSAERPVSDVPTVSSRYSQPSPEIRRQGFRKSAAPAAPLSVYTDVSPPSSPEINADYHSHDLQNSPDISPVEEMPAPSGLREFPPPQYRSNIPVPHHSQLTYPTHLRPINSLNNDNAIVADRGSAATRWDDFIESQATPRGSALITADSSRMTSNIPRKMPAGNGDQGIRLSFAQRAMHHGITGLGLDTQARQPLRGAPARQMTASPMTEKSHPQLKKIPGRETIAISRQSQGTTSPARVESGLTTPTGPVKAETSGHQPRFLAEIQDADMKPIVPLKAGNNTPPYNPSSPTATTMPSTALSTTNTWYAAASKSPPFDPSGYNEVHRLESFSLLTGAQEKSQGQPDHRDRYAVQAVAEEHPSSRFSFTTYATDTTRDSRPSSSEDNVATPTAGEAQSPILGRKRPITSGYNTKATARKPIASQQLSPTSPINNSEWRDSKELPKIPQEVQSEDLIENLLVQVDNLHARRATLHRVIWDLTRSSSFSKPRLETMKSELADVQRQEHETGLRLHRAYRRRDRLEYREPTAMWVRRVTG
jgi:hypothetical protein